MTAPTAPTASAKPANRRRVTDSAALGRVPAVLLVPSLLGLALLVVPLVGLVSQTPFRTLWSRLQEPGVLDALWLSLRTATVSALICLVLGVPLAWLLARTHIPARQVVRAFVLVPLVMPPVVGGVALISAFGLRGLLGRWLESWFDYSLPFTTPAVVIAQTFVALPFLVVSVEGALRSADRRFDDVAATLGASRWRTFARVSLPLALPGVISGVVLAWARALGEFGATITFAGNTEGTTRTMPLQIYDALNEDPKSAYVLSLLLLAISVVVLASLRERWLSGVVR